MGSALARVFLSECKSNSIHNLRLEQTFMATLVVPGFRAAQVLTASRGLRRSELLNWCMAV